MLAQLEHRVKALAAAVLGAVIAYAATAVQAGDPLTIHGLIAAAVGALAAGVGVHQAPANGPHPDAAKPKERPKKAS